MQTLNIIAETKQWLAIDKPSGLLVEKNPFETSVEEILNEKYPFVGIVHRLDRVTSGILLIAKKKSSLKLLNQQFSNRTVQKTYLAWVENKPHKTQATLQHFLKKDQKNKRAIVSNKAQKDFVKVSLQYQIIQEQNENYLLEIKPHQGKFHQIRAQLAFAGFPILNDLKYIEPNNTQHIKKIALQAYRLQFICPTSQEKIDLQLKKNNFKQNAYR